MEASDIQLKKEKRMENYEEEEHFVKLFHKVLEENRGQLSDEQIGIGVERVISYFQGKVSGTCNREKYVEANILCGFFHRFPPLFAGTTRNRILTALDGCEELRSCFHHPSLKLVDVGTGAGSDLVGLFSALYEKNFPFQSLEVIGMDYNENWKKFFDGIKTNLVEGNFGNASCILKEKEIRFSFVCTNIFQLSSENKEKLNEADFILMKGFLSILNYDTERSGATKIIASEMKKGALLVIIDSPHYEEYFQNKNLRLVFTSRKYLPSPSDNQNSQVLPLGKLEDSTSQNMDSTSESQITESVTSGFPISNSHPHSTWENFDSDKTYVKFFYNFRHKPVETYGPGFSQGSNQQIFVYERK